MTGESQRPARLVRKVVGAWLTLLVMVVCAVAAQAQQTPAKKSWETVGARAAATRNEYSSAADPRRASATVRRRLRPLVPSDDWTYRPTVLVRRGTSQGTGTIIASVEGETLVLTVAHVVRDPGPIVVELQRFNLGVERITAPSGSWPRHVSAAVAATDPAADLAVLKIARMRALPYVAHLAHRAEEPAASSQVTSIGIDLGTELAAWTTAVVETASFKLNNSPKERRFLLTDQIPEHGHSGGGLFGAGGELVGVCIGHAEVLKGTRMGVFGSLESIRLLLDDHKLTASIARSEARRARTTQPATTRAAVPRTSSRPSVTSTRATNRNPGRPAVH